MQTFQMNGYVWRIQFVHPIDDRLIDRTGVTTVATTDPNTMTIYMSNALAGDFFMRVLLHEIAHCALFSFGLIYDIHRLVEPCKWIEAEEWVCNFIADYSPFIYDIALAVS